MSTEYEILELVNERPLLIGELREKFTIDGVSTKESVHTDSAVAFLEKHKLVEIVPTDKGGSVKITLRGSRTTRSEIQRKLRELKEILEA